MAQCGGTEWTNVAQDRETWRGTAEENMAGWSVIEFK